MSELDAPLIGCEFVHGSRDCYGLVRRWYWQVRGVVLRDFPRSADWWNDGHSDLYTQGYALAGFAALPLDTAPEPGDVLLMRIASRNAVPNHAAVYLGGDVILHHKYGGLSMREGLPRYRERLTHILRYRGTNGES